MCTGLIVNNVQAWSNTRLESLSTLHVQACKIQKIASGAQNFCLRLARNYAIFQAHARNCCVPNFCGGVPKINARLKFMHSYVCVLKIMRAMLTRQDAEGTHVAQFSRALFTGTAIMQIYFRLVINWPITAPTSFIIHNVNMICDDSYQLPQDTLGHSEVFRYSISRRTLIIKAKNYIQYSLKKCHFGLFRV